MDSSCEAHVCGPPPKERKSRSKTARKYIEETECLGSFETGNLGARESKVHRARLMSDDLVPHLQQSGSGCVELFSPEVRAAVGVDELGIDPHLGAARLHRAFRLGAHARVLADRLGIDFP
jgi:hypothetical protein